MPPALLPLAATGSGLSSFGPWVPAVDDRGRVAFTAVHRDGRTGLHLVTPEGPLGAWVSEGTEGVESFTSHPDLDGEGRLYVYATLGDGRHALVCADASGLGLCFATGPQGVGHGPSRPALSSLGPTGPTASRRGEVALRGTEPNGARACHLWAGGALRTLAVGSGAEGFDGLPLVNERGEVALRARGGGRDRLLVGAPDELRAVGSGHAELGRFPCLAEDGAVGVPARGAAGWSYRRWRGEVEEELLPAGRFPFVRGGLLSTGGLLAVYVQTERSPLAVLVGPDPERDLLVGIGLPLFGSPVVDLALNPVSGAEVGWIAIRVTLGDGRSLVCRTEDPVRAWRA